MSKWGCLLLVAAVSAQVAQTQADTNRPSGIAAADLQGESTATPLPIPTVAIPDATPFTVPTVTIPHPMPTPRPTPKARPTKRPHRTVKRAVPTATPRQWILAYLTSYCPGTAGWLASSGTSVFYGMLANDFYPFGTRVYIPVIGMVGVVEDRIGSFAMWNHFDVWSPVCYSTPTGWFRVAVQGR